jgi:MFS family permease
MGGSALLARWDAPLGSILPWARSSMAIARLRRVPAAFGHDILILLGLLLAAGAVGGPTRSLLPIYLEHDLAWTPPAIAAIAAVRLLAAALSAPLGGILTDTSGARRTLRLGLLGLPVAALCFLTPAWPLLLLLGLASGLADGLQSTGSQSYLIARADRATIGRATSVFFVGTTLGGALGNLGAGALLRGWGFVGLGPVGLGASLLVILAVTALPAGEDWPVSRRGSPRGAFAGYRTLLRAPRVRQLALLRFLSTCSWGTMSLLWPLLIARLSGDPATAALFGTVSLIVAVAAQLSTGRLIDAIGPGGPAAVLTVLVPLVATLSALAIAAGLLPALFAFGVAGTAVAWSLSGTTLPLIRAAAPAGESGQVVGLLHLMWSLAMLTGTLLAGWLIVVGATLPFWTVALITLPAIVAAYRLWRSLRPASRGTTTV